MWLHESESNSLITEAYENKIFLTIIYISNNSLDKSHGWPRGAALHSHQVIVGICGLWVSKNPRMMEVG